MSLEKTACNVSHSVNAKCVSLLSLQELERFRTHVFREDSL